MNNYWDRRGFLKKSALTIMAGTLGARIAFAENMPAGYLPLAFQSGDPFSMKDKHPEMIKRNDRPWNIETPPHLLDDAVTPVDKMFVRNNGLIPESLTTDWKLVIDGESVKEPVEFTLASLKKEFKSYSYNLVIECGGNGRYGFYPPASGNQWQEGAVNCGRWTGVRLRDVLEKVGLKDDAVYIGYYGADLHLNHDPDKVVISRGVPIKKALEDETLLAWSLNGKDIPAEHGFPLRLVVGGWPGSVSGKWLKRISVRNKIHDGEKMLSSYWVPKHPVQPGEDVADDNKQIIESMPVKSVITYPKSGAMIKPGRSLAVRGHAWAGDLSVKAVDVSIDYGATWQKAELRSPVNRLAWQQWSATVNFPDTGYYEVWARATDEEGKAQPMVIPAWNPKGYLNNSCHRIAVKVES